MLSRESIVFLSYLNASGLPYEIEINFFINTQIDLTIYELPYYYYRLHWNNNYEGHMVLDNFKTRFGKLSINFLNFPKFNLITKNMTDMNGLFSKANDSLAIFSGAHDFNYKLFNKTTRQV